MKRFLKLLESFKLSRSSILQINCIPELAQKIRCCIHLAETMKKDLLQSECFYHIYNHANGSENLFREAENYRFFLEKWSKYISPVASTYAYCLMPNHFHFLIRTKSELEIEQMEAYRKFASFQKFTSKQFSNLFSCYTQSYNKVYNRRGSLFMQNFKAKEIATDDYLTQIIYHIHHNPVHHGFCTSVLDWPYSSFHTLVSEKRTQLERKEVQNWFGNKEELLKFHRQGIKGLHHLEMEFT